MRTEDKLIADRGGFPTKKKTFLKIKHFVFRVSFSPTKLKMKKKVYLIEYQFVFLLNGPIHIIDPRVSTSIHL